MFISVEGVDGSGKSTQLNLLLKYLDQKGIPYVFTREPGGTLLAEKIRGILLDPTNEIPVLTEAYLFAAGRADHVTKVIKPALEAGKLVISDRFIGASIAYQAFAGGLGYDLVRMINGPALQGVWPDRTIILDVPPKLAEDRRTAKAQDRIEAKADTYHRQVREGYLWMAENDPAHVTLVDATGTEDQVQAAIRILVHQAIERKNRA